LAAWFRKRIWPFVVGRFGRPKSLNRITVEGQLKIQIMALTVSLRMRFIHVVSIAVSSLMVLSLFSVVAFASPPVILNPRLRAGGSNSLNWAGYAVPAKSGTVTGASGSWVVPSVSCSKKSTYVAFWAGVDGYNDSTVEQGGVLVQCSQGAPVYSAWTEFYPAAPTYASWKPSPGDIVSVTTTCTAVSGGATCTVTVSDGAETYGNTATVSGADLSSAECITERPAIGGSLTTLANFGVAEFGQSYTLVSGTCYATIKGSSEAFGTYPSVSSITMVTFNGKVLAYPSPLSSDGSSFTVTYGAPSPGPGSGHK
jgi:hypothetical protein